jgi:hypothetical protein
VLCVKKLSSDGGDSGRKKCKRGYGGACRGESGDMFCAGAFGRNLASVVMKIFPHLIYFIKIFYKLCIFNAIYKDNDAINCIYAQRKKGSFPSTLTGHKLGKSSNIDRQCC